MRAGIGIVAWIAMLVIPASGADSASPPKWSLGPDGGWISALVIDPHNPETIYAGTRHNGVFKSIDRGTSWTAVNAGLVFDAFPGGDFTIPVHKSTDGGASWSSASAGLSYMDRPSNEVTIAVGF